MDNQTGHDQLNAIGARRVVLIPQKHTVWSRGEWLSKGKFRCGLWKKGDYIEAGQAKTAHVYYITQTTHSLVLGKYVMTDCIDWMQYVLRTIHCT